MTPSLRGRAALAVALAMLAFASNSLLCRAALRDSATDPARFTALRVVSGALVLVAIVRLRDGAWPRGGDGRSALALFAYAAAFSFAYVALPAGTGALLLFGAVQATMIGHGLRSGERPTPAQAAGLVLALLGLLVLLAPGLAAPPLPSALLMLGAGVAWGAYSLRGRVTGDATAVTAGNFARAVPFAVALALVPGLGSRLDAAGAGYAVASGAIASGAGYAIWYSALPALGATQAASVQLSVPVLAALGGVLLLGEPPSWRLAVAAVAILGGIAPVLRERAARAAPRGTAPPGGV